MVWDSPSIVTLQNRLVCSMNLPPPSTGSGAVHEPAMRTARGCAQQLILPASAGICRGTRASEAARPDFHRLSGLRQPTAPGGAVAGGGFSWPPTGPAADAEARVMGSPP